jgi:hypothetical protein
MTALFCLLLAACGGGGGGGSDGTPTQNETSTGGNTSSNGNGTSNPDGGTNTPPSGNGSNSPPSSGSGGDTPSSGGNTGSPPTINPPASSFVASVTQAPDDGATISGTVRILVSGSGILNVELLPATGYAPLTARGVVDGDNEGAYIDFNTTVMPDGPVTLRVAAFNSPPGQNGSEITAMPARTWTIRNSAASIFAAQLVSAPSTIDSLGSQPDGTISSTAHFEVSGANLENVELVSAKDESIKYGTFTISADKTRATLDWAYRSFNNWAYEFYPVRIVAWDVPAGEPGNSIEVMAPRSYRQSLPILCRGMGTCGGEAP